VLIANLFHNVAQSKNDHDFEFFEILKFGNTRVPSIKAFVISENYNDYRPKP